MSSAIDVDSPSRNMLGRPSLSSNLDTQHERCNNDLVAENFVSTFAVHVEVCTCRTRIEHAMPPPPAYLVARLGLRIRLARATGAVLSLAREVTVG